MNINKNNTHGTPMPLLMNFTPGKRIEEADGFTFTFTGHRRQRKKHRQDTRQPRIGKIPLMT